ncbi:MAG: hypothetical protein IPI08_10785 [Betaproteobacteria bacterium]|jgi:hypothetical protein|nr:hypothetical protein [Betaproteobacteria bacterium]MBK8106501.1 hypothetical protein [Betaproteobacteria bacterium]
MTLVAAWIRRTVGVEELVVASDSRLTGGIALNHAPKLFPLERADSLLAYCGPTVVAYPILLQVKASLDANERTRKRLVDIVDLKVHIEKSIEGLRAQIKDLPSGDATNRAFKFLLAGYSWKHGCFRAWIFRYDTQTREFNAHSMPRLGRGFVFMSDVDENERRARERLNRLVFERRDSPLPYLDWEPLRVLLSFIQDPNCDDSGGPPQIIKVYRHANVLPINVLWHERASLDGIPYRRYEVAHLGRPLLDGEPTALLTLNLEDWQFVEPWNIRSLAKQYNDRELRTALHTKLVRLLDRQRRGRERGEVIHSMLKRGAPFRDIQAYLSSVD